jgi:transposase
MHTPEIQMPHSGRRRGRYSNDFKRQVIAACLAPGVSTAAIALSNGLNAKLVRRWVVESSLRSDSGQSKTSTALAAARGNPGFVPVRLDPVSPASNTRSTDICIELQNGCTTVQIHWPLQASGQCALWLREVLA